MLQRGTVLWAAVLLVSIMLGLSAAGTWGINGPWGPPRMASWMGFTDWPWRPPKPPWITTPLPGSQTLRLRMIDFAFRPSVLTAPAGVRLNLELVNGGASVHTLVIPVLGVRTMLMPGERTLIGIGSVAPGTYEFFCEIPAHRDAGMVGRLVAGPGN